MGPGVHQTSSLLTSFQGLRERKCKKELQTFGFVKLNPIVKNLLIRESTLNLIPLQPQTEPAAEFICYSALSAVCPSDRCCSKTHSLQTVCVHVCVASFDSEASRLMSLKETSPWLHLKGGDSICGSLGDSCRQQMFPGGRKHHPLKHTHQDTHSQAYINIKSKFINTHVSQCCERQGESPPS